MDRKVLTLEEIISLNRRPTLQEMVDLSIVDYTKYLFKKGVIKHIPESGSVYDYEDIPDVNNIITYDPYDDVILELKRPDYNEESDAMECYFHQIYNINESLDGFTETGIVYVNDKAYHYESINNTCAYGIKKL